MKLFLFCILFALATMPVLGQELTTIRRGLSRELWEIYQASSYHVKVKDGTYEVTTNKKETLVKGQFKNGQKVGVWTYYDAGVPIQIYDFSAGKLLYNIPDSLTMVRSDYALEAVTDEGDTIQPPNKIGGANYGFLLLYEPRDMPEELKGMTASAQMTYVFTVTEEGKLQDWTVMYTGTSIHEIIVKKSILHLPADAYEFVAAKVNGKPVKSKLSYTVPLLVDHRGVIGTSNGVVTEHP